MSTPAMSRPLMLKRRRSFVYRFLSVFILLSALSFLGKLFLIKVYTEELLILGSDSNLQNTISEECNSKIHCTPDGSESLPKGIVTCTSNMEMRTEWDSWNEEKSERRMSLLAIAAGIKQKEIVNKVIKKFPVSDFVLMLFHYDGIVDKWKNFEWNSHAIHVSAVNQTKWWFAKRFLHPDLVSAYSYIFLWDEDFGVDHFSPIRYLSIVQKEGLEISQPALDPRCSAIHHASTARKHNYTVHRLFVGSASAKLPRASTARKQNSTVHRLFVESASPKFHHAGTARKQNSTVHRLFVDSASAKFPSGRISLVSPRTCTGNNTKPPCAGFVEMMAPVFSRASWRCVWHMIQGNRIQNVGIVDAEYISHMDVRSLGGYKVMRECFSDGDEYRSRWSKAVEEDKCWIDTYGP